MIRHRFYICGGILNESISQMYEMRVQTMRLVGGNLLKILVQIVMIIAHSYYLL